MERFAHVWETWGSYPDPNCETYGQRMLRCYLAGDITEEQYIATKGGA